MHISDWLIKNPDLHQRIMRVWLLDRAVDDALTKDERHVDPDTAGFLSTTSLANAWEVAWGVYFKGNEEEAWASLQRFADGKSMRFLVTVHSMKYDGLAMVVTDVPDKEGAFEKVARLWSDDIRETWVYVQLQDLDGGDRDLLLPKGYNETDIRDAYESEGGAYRFFEMLATPLVFNQNLPEVAAW